MAGALLKDKIYKYIAQNVQNGIYTPGVKISEESVANDLGVSRTPVRGALSQLADEGVVEKIPRRGFFVKKTDSTKSKEVFEVLGYLDRRVAELACPYLEQGDYRKMEEYIAKMDLAINFSNFSDYSVNQNLFHEVYAAKCPNRTLADLLRSLTFSHIPHTYVGDSEELFRSFAACNGQHREMLAMFTSGDIAGLGPLVERHWSTIDYELYI